MNTDRFKFRAWDKKEKEYKPCTIFGDGEVYDCDVMTCYIGEVAQEPDRYIIEQCTGLKDKNGNLIFEGDILKVPAFPTGSVNMRVCWSDSPCHWDLKYTGKRAELEDMIVLVLELGNASEIVGNIHEMEIEK